MSLRALLGAMVQLTCDERGCGFTIDAPPELPLPPGWQHTPGRQHACPACVELRRPK